MKKIYTLVVALLMSNTILAQENECTITCIDNIIATTTSSTESVVVEYELGYECTNQSICEIAYSTESPISQMDNNHAISTNYSGISWIVANDFDVPIGESFTISKFIPIVQLTPANEADIYFYQDNNGVPGTLITSFENVTYETMTPLTGWDFSPMYEVTYELPETVELTSGKYWIGFHAEKLAPDEVSMYLALMWASMGNNNLAQNGVRAHRSSNNGASWNTSLLNSDGLFKLVSDCDGAELILAEGYESFVSGVEFPLGTTTIVHNLMLNGEIIDTCSFDVTVQLEETAGCTITCLEDISIQVEAGQTTSVVEYEIEYTCETGVNQTELILIEGLASGSEFPVGTTTITYNLIYQDEVLDSCSFDVVVQLVEPSVCTITCLEDISIQTEEEQTTAVVEYEIEYTCETGVNQTELILIEGLASGSEFPVGITTITYNLIYQDEVLDSCTFDVVVEESLNRTDFNGFNFSVYPNPVKDILNISYEDLITQVSIYDLSSRKIYDQKIGKSETQINISSFPVGTYIVKAESNQVTKVIKIVKQ